MEEREKKIAVAPYAGAWIETVGVKVHRRAEIRSLPTRERGLKLTKTCEKPQEVTSLPTRERGLKPALNCFKLQFPQVAPYAGAWIETLKKSSKSINKKSLPTRERGLKLVEARSPLRQAVSLPTRERGLKLPPL